MTITVLIVDDHRPVRQGIRLLQQADPGFEVIGEAANEVDAAAETCLKHPDVILPVLHRLAATAPTHREVPPTEIVVLTSLHENAGAIAMMRDGVTSRTQAAIRVTRLGLLPAGIQDGPKHPATNSQC
jgi:DNA-binding NarL/FixJ family response regulator